MRHEPDFKSKQKYPDLVQGLIQNDGRRYSNWGLHRSTVPAVFAEPISYADVQAIVRDSARFPPPVNPVGSMLSVASTFINEAERWSACASSMR